MTATIEQLDRRLTSLSETSERIRSNLLDVEVDPTYEVLTQAQLTGETAARWTRAREAISELWCWHSELDGLLERARDVRGRRSRPGDEQLAALAELLEGRSVDLATDPVPLAERSLLGSDERCTPDDLLQRMSRAFEEVRDTIAAVAAAWDALLPRLEVARRSLAACDELAANVGAPTALTRVREKLDGVAAALRSDPLSASAAGLDEAEAALVAARAELDAADALRRDIAARLAEGRAQLDELRRAHEAAGLAYEETAAKIADPGVEPPPAVPDDVAQGLDRVEALAATHDWRAAGDALARWTAAVAARIADEQRAAAQSRLPLDARNELRGLLAAYQGKAMRLGRVEDPELMGLYERAREELHVAPTDLDRARDLVRRYQRALTAVPAPEAKR